MNNVSLIGTLTTDPELRTLNNEKATPVTEIRIAVRRPRSTKDGTDADFLSVTLYGRQAEVVAQYGGKGRRLGINGRLQLDQWETDGEKRSRLYVIGEHVDIIDWPERQAEPAPEPAAA